MNANVHHPSICNDQQNVNIKRKIHINLIYKGAHPFRNGVTDGYKLLRHTNTQTNPEISLFSSRSNN
jgi:hypothetical protein